MDECGLFAHCSGMMENSLAAKHLKALRVRSGLSVQELADRLDVPKSTYASKEDKFKKPYLPLDFVQQLALILPGLGDPPISKGEVMALAGLLEAHHIVPISEGGQLSEDNVAYLTPNQHKMMHAKKASTQKPPTELAKGSPILEVDVRGGMGGGGEAALVNHVDEHGNIIAGDDVRAIWELPSDYVRHELRVSPKSARLIEVRGDSMSPTLESGDRVMIDTSDQVPSPGGLFALWDGFGVIVKRLEHVLNSDPPRLKIKSDNPRHDEVERTFDEVNIIGRVVWFARRI